MDSEWAEALDVGMLNEASQILEASDLAAVLSESLCSLNDLIKSERHDEGYFAASEMTSLYSTDQQQQQPDMCSREAAFPSLQHPVYQPVPDFSISTTDVPDSPSNWEDYSFDFPTQSTSYANTATSTPMTAVKPEMRIRRSGRPPASLGQMPAAESAKKLRRREQNRVAAQRCRIKKKRQTEQTMTEYQEMQQSNDRMRMEIEQLQKQKARLEEILMSHLKHCSLRATHES